ncbi:hypothetical protein A3F06_02840 [candidate division TM6 bacterium RIFCSPHIGHO2_12_FULL_36_22]|nr:MAG: hypothetical protein A3F06_02840 [candidate division TM6 bacterium RIFCSPHIGHO2_12_FULL_36_22]
MLNILILATHPKDVLNVMLLRKATEKSVSVCSCGLQLNADLNASRNIKNIWCRANGYTSGPESTGLLQQVNSLAASSLL